MNPIKGVLCLLAGLFLCQTVLGQNIKNPVLKINPVGDLEITDASGQKFTFKSITLQREVVIDGIRYKVSFGPGASNGDMVVILQPSDQTAVRVADSKFPSALVNISKDALAIFTFNSANGTFLVESGNVGRVSINSVALQQGERVSVNSDGTLVRNLGSGPAPAQTTAVAQNSTGGQTTENSEQPAPTTADIGQVAGIGNSFFADLRINLSPEASTPFLSGQ